MTKATTQTAEEWAAAYAARSDVTVEWLRQHGREVRPCDPDCGDERCEGWQMAHVTDYEFCEEKGHDIYTVEESWAQTIHGCMRCTWQFVARADGG